MKPIRIVHKIKSFSILVIVLVPYILELDMALLIYYVILNPEVPHMA